MAPTFDSVTTSNPSAGWIIALVYIFFIISLLAVVVKIGSNWRVNARLMTYDILIIVSLVLALGDTVGITIASKHGFGQHVTDLDPADLQVTAKAMYAVNIIAVAALAFTKASNAVFNLEISNKPALVWSMKGLLLMISAWGIAGIFAFAFKCDLPDPWRSRENCIDRYAYFVAIGVANIATDMAIVFVPAAIVWNIQTTKSRRWLVTALFALRLLTPIVTVVALLTLKPSNSDPTSSYVLLTIWISLMINLSIVSACILSFKRVLSILRPERAVLEANPPVLANGKEEELQVLTFNSQRSQQSFKTRIVSSIMAKDNDQKMSPEWVGTSHWRGDIGDIGPVTRGKEVVERSESIEGLSEDVILKTKVFTLEYEERSKSGEADSGAKVTSDTASDSSQELIIQRYSTET